MNKSNCWLQSYMRGGARLMCSCSLLAEGLLDGELLTVGRDVMRPLDDDACAAPAGNETGVPVLQPGLPHRAHATRGRWWSRDGTRLGPGRSSPLHAAVRLHSRTRRLDQPTVTLPASAGTVFLMRLEVAIL
jgi:hypothetical protein